MNFLIAEVKNSKVMNILYIIIILGLLITFLDWKHPYNHFQRITFVSLLLLIFILFIIDYAFFYKVKIIGEIEFTDDVVTIYNIENVIIKSFKLNNIEKIKLRCFSFKGYIAQQTRSASFIPSKGNGNSIEFVYDNENFSYEIFLANEKETNKFKILNRFLEEKNIDVNLKMMQ